MKFKLLITFLFTTLASYAQKDTVGLKLPIQSDKLVYEGIVNASNINKTILYVNVKQWFIDYFVNSKTILQSDDKESGRLVGRATIPIPWKTLGVTGNYEDTFTIQIDVKDGKYRYRIYNIQLLLPARELGSFGTAHEQEFTPEGLISNLYGKKANFLTKSQCRQTLQSIDTATKVIIVSLQKAAKNVSNSF